MIDPLTAVISYLAADDDLAALIGNRIASKHQYALGSGSDGQPRGWSLDQAGLQLGYAGGGITDRAGSRRAQLTATAYAPTQRAAVLVVQQLIVICSAFIRTTAITEDGTALMYWMVPVGDVATDRDLDLSLDVARLALNVSVASDSV